MEGAFILTPLTLTPSDETLAFNLIDELNSSDHYWLQETNEDYIIPGPPISTVFSLENYSENDVFKSPHDTFLYSQNEVISNISTNTSLSVKKRLKLALENLQKITRDRDYLIQVWMPVKKGGKSVLSANNQLFCLSSNCKSLEDYRDVSKRFQFSAEEENDDKEGIDFVKRVFLNKLPEWTPDVKFFREDEYIRVTYAQQLNICGSLVLPVFNKYDEICLGVIEIVTTTQRVNYHHELERVSNALEAVDLRSSDVLGPPMIKAYDDDSYRAALTEIQEILKFVCDQHGLPLAQTWAPCIQQGKPGIRHSQENYAYCVSTIDSACYIPHPQLLGFHEACSEHHLLRRQGLAGEAFMTNQPCFSSDISAFSTKEYPLSHYARMFGLCASIAVRLRSMYTGSNADFVLEFILPLECQDKEQQREMLNSISCSIQQVCRSLRVVTDQEILEETSFTTYEDEDTQNFAYSEPIIAPLEYLHEEQEGDFKLTHWDEDDMAEFTMKDQTFRNLDVKTSVDYDGDVFSIGEYYISGGRKPSQKRRTKPEKSISLQVLRPYFAGSLKDAAKSIGVCPTTLKRICRLHGITRWPSRKIKKVEHSLRKLQHVIDSVQGVENGFQFSSLYNSISTNRNSAQTHLTDTKLNDQLNRQFKIEIDNLSDDATCQGNTENNVGQVPVGKLMKLKVMFGEERIRFSMKKHWQFNDLLNEIAKRFKIEEYSNSGRIEIKYLDDDSEWVLLECDEDLDECLEVHNSCGSSMIKLLVHRDI